MLRSVYLGQVELFAGDPAAAGVALPNYEALERMGEKGYLSTARPSSPRPSTPRDVTRRLRSSRSRAPWRPAQTSSRRCWRCVRAKVLARRGEQDEAERIAREAVEIADETDFLQTRADARVALAEVLGLVGQPDASTRALAEASELYRQRDRRPRRADARAAGRVVVADEAYPARVQLDVGEAGVVVDHAMQIRSRACVSAHGSYMTIARDL